VDPNIFLKDRYKKMIDFYKMNNGTYKVISKRFEDTTIKDFDNKKFDIMFTSPPYYNAEGYSEDFPYKDLEDWLKKFIYISLSKVVELLNKNGKIYLMISDVKIFIKEGLKIKIEYMEKILKYLSNIDGIIYLGMKKFKFIDYNNKVIVQPIWIFQKII
jgi:DNA modification methylase